MGFLFHAIKVPKVITIAFFLNLISHAHYLLIGALTHLGLYKQPPAEESADSAASPNNYILILDSSSPSLVPIPVHVVTAAIKNRVPVIEYGEFLRRDENSGGGEKGCSICLECIEGGDEIRELCNCRHLFHRVCLDTWIDEGQVTCPLCRSILLPPRLILRCPPPLHHPRRRLHCPHHPCTTHAAADSTHTVASQERQRDSLPPPPLSLVSTSPLPPPSAASTLRAQTQARPDRNP